MNYSKRYTELNSIFRLGKECRLEETNVDIRFFSFRSKLPERRTRRLMTKTDRRMAENATFIYPMFIPSAQRQYGKAILLLHGLNERNWSKYLTWAEFLCRETGKPVILFPIAFHINRAPAWWSNPRKLTDIIDFRRKQYTDEGSISFANVALSERLSENPTRFYLSGRQTSADLALLFRTIKKGRHPVFTEDAQIDIFSYSIGSFLSQTLLMANPRGLFSDSRLFMFCGGSIFSSMYGASRNILDKPTFEKLHHYYVHIFGHETKVKWLRDKVFDAFESMISPERKQTEREAFFEQLGNRISGISLARDTVIPYHGIQEAMGMDYTKSHVRCIDFPFPYSHENPFPVTGNINLSEVNEAYLHVFSSAAEFLA